ncbi:MAG: hypothetical protein K6F54_13190 [Lachnospiraceae bacterium]|nr:hypothetical protein [Lachnospiraceae bacterium]
MYSIGHGIVTGHKKLPDAIDMHISAVEGIHIDEEAGEAVLTTRNSVYHCPLAYCRFNKQDAYPDIIPDYERLKEKYKDKIEYPSIEPGDRKKVDKENAEAETPVLPGGDLYPAGIVE